MSKRLEAVVADIVGGVRGALVKHDVTFDEYRQGIAYIMKTADQHELPLLIDVFLNTTICQIENRNFGGSLSTLEGPYFLDDAPFVDGALKTYNDDRHEPLLLRGKVSDEFGAPIAGAVVDVWHSTPDGHYGGFHNNIPRDFAGRHAGRRRPAGGCEHRQCLDLAVAQIGKRLRAFGGKPQIDLPADQILHRRGCAAIGNDLEASAGLALKQDADELARAART
jgi:chlorocatechol 1,2-dioxygenase